MKPKITKAILLQENEQLEATLNIYKQQAAQHVKVENDLKSRVEELKRDLHWIRQLCQSLSEAIRARS